MAAVTDDSIIRWLRSMGCRDPNGFIVSKHNISKLNLPEMRKIWDCLLSRCRPLQIAERARDVAKRKLHIETVRERLEIRDKLESMDTAIDDLLQERHHYKQRLHEQMTEVVGAEANWQQDRSELQVR